MVSERRRVEEAGGKLHVAKDIWRIGRAGLQVTRSGLDLEAHIGSVRGVSKFMPFGGKEGNTYYIRISASESQTGVQRVGIVEASLVRLKFQVSNLMHGSCVSVPMTQDTNLKCITAFWKI